MSSECSQLNTKSYTHHCTNCNPILPQVQPQYRKINKYITTTWGWYLVTGSVDMPIMLQCICLSTLTIMLVRINSAFFYIEHSALYTPHEHSRPCLIHLTTTGKQNPTPALTPLVRLRIKVQKPLLKLHHGVHSRQNL